LNKRASKTAEKGLLFVVSAPSGAGKTSLCRDAASSIEGLHFSISHTTRAPRPGEQHGKDYFFLKESAFREKIDQGDFLEWAKVHGNFYGTASGQLKRWTQKGEDIILDIDSQGAMTLQQRCGEGIYIYILPPSFDILRQRLTARGTDSDAEISRRLLKAKEEVGHFHRYHYLIVNQSYEKAKKVLEAVILAERARIRPQEIPSLEARLIRPLLEKSEGPF